MAVDVQGYGGRNDRAQSEVQHDLPRLIENAARGAAIDRSRWSVQAKGDEQLAVLPLDGDQRRLVDDFVRHLVAALAAHNDVRLPPARLRLRVAIHHGLVELADNGFAGRAVVETCRMLESDAAHAALLGEDASDLVLMLSDDVFRSLVLGGHTVVRPDAFREVAVQEKEYDTRAWLWVPERRTPAGDTRPTGGVDPSPFAAPTPGIRARQVSVTTFHGPVDLRGGVVGFGGRHG